MKQPAFLARTRRLIIFLLIFLFFGLLSIYGLKGSFSRYAQDDYCYGYRVRTMGFWNTQIRSYLYKAEYVSNRFSTTLAHSIVEELGGSKFVPYLASIELLAWLAALVYVSFQLQLVIFSKASYLTSVISALSIVFFSAYLAPNQYQILFWLAAMQTYFTPIIMATFVFGRLISIVRSPKFKIHFGIELFLLAFFAGGFSETTNLWQLTCWGFILVWSLIKQKKMIVAKNAIRPAFILVSSTTLALAALVFSPANLKGAPVPYHPNPFTLIWQSILYGFEFLWYGIRGTPLPYLVILLLGFFLGAVSTPSAEFRARDIAGVILAAVLVLVTVSVVVMLPAMYATSHYPGDRALLPAEVALVICLFISGWGTAYLVSVLKPGFFSIKAVLILQCLLGLALFGYIAHVIPHVYDKFPNYQSRAAAWDLRQGLILEQKAAGIQDVTAPAFDSVYSITELQYDAHNWVNRCAARYYGVRTISTVDDYARISAHPIGK
jgi:hypothetical protein